MQYKRQNQPHERVGKRKGEVGGEIGISELKMSQGLVFKIINHTTMHDYIKNYCGWHWQYSDGAVCLAIVKLC